MIGVAYDRSVESERALELARTLAAHHQAEFSAFEAIRPPVHGRDPANVAGESQELVDEARRRIAALGGVHADASFGDAIDELRQYEQSVDLLVIGSHKYGPIDRVLEESTSQQLADEPSSPLLVLAARCTPRWSRRPSPAHKAAAPRCRQWTARATRPELRVRISRSILECTIRAKSRETCDDRSPTRASPSATWMMERQPSQCALASSARRAPTIAGTSGSSNSSSVTPGSA
jgi:nucleotide-binding universal stress UspA family protein